MAKKPKWQVEVTLHNGHSYGFKVMEYKDIQRVINDESGMPTVAKIVIDRCELPTETRELTMQSIPAPYQ